MRSPFLFTGTVNKKNPCIMLKRFILLGLFAFSFAFGANAQSADNDHTFPGSLFPRHAVKNWSVGLFAGQASNNHIVNVAYAIDMKYSGLDGFTAGLTASRHFSGWFSLRADMAFVQKNYRLDRDGNFVSFMYTEMTNNYVSLPVTAVISMGRSFRLNGFFGGYVGYWLSGHREGKSLSVPYLIVGNEDDCYYDEAYEFSSERDNRFDAGLTYGFAVRCSIVQKIDLSAEMRWYYGLTDVQKKYMENLNPRYNTTRTLQFGLSYWL